MDDSKQKNSNGYELNFNNKNDCYNPEYINANQQLLNNQIQPQNIGDYNNCLGGKNLNIFNIKTDEGLKIILGE